MRVFEQPAAVRTLLASDEIDGLGEVRIGRGAGAAEVIQPAQNIVVPGVGELELRPFSRALGLLILHNRLDRGERAEKGGARANILHLCGEQQ